MRIDKEFAPITIRIETQEELRVLKKMASRAMSFNRHVGFFTPCHRVEDYEVLAKKLVDL